MYCSNCGNKINESEKFCSNCGSPVKKENNIQETPNTTNPQPTNNTQKEKKSNNTIKYIAVIIITIALALVLIYILLNKKEDEKIENINEYETNEIENTNESNTINPTNPTTPSNDSTYKYKGFNFKKITGFTYEEQDDLIIYDDNYKIDLDITQINYETVKTQHYNEITKSLENYGYKVSNLQTKTYTNKEYITCEVTYNNKKALYFITKANNNYIFEGIVANKNFTINYNNIETVNNIIKDATYVGNYSDYSTTFSNKINLEQ